MGIASIILKAVALAKYVPEIFKLIKIGKELYEKIIKDEELTNPSTSELLANIKENKGNAKETFEQIQKAFAKIEE